MNSAGFVWLLSALVTSTFVNVKIVITPNEPKGIKFSIEDKGYSSVALHYTVNRKMIGFERGDRDVDIKRKTGNQFVFEDIDVLLEPGDVIYYWVVGSSRNTGISHRLMDMSYTYTGTTCVGPKCQYACNCYKKKCLPDKKGLCHPGFPCEEKYFGYTCQFISLCDGLPQEDPVLHDRNVSTCYSGLKKDITIRMERNRFSFLHLVFKNNSYIPLLLGTTLTLLNGSERLSCIRWSYIPFEYENNTIEVHCFNNSRHANGLIITGELLQLLCDVYISGGRNVALFKPVTLIPNQTGTVVPGFEASNAVDGKYGNGFKEGECVQTVPDKVEQFEVKYEYPYAIDYLWIRKKPNTIMPHIRFQIYFDRGWFYTYNVTGIISNPSLRISHDRHHNNTLLKLIFVNRTLSLSFCEIEAYGDCPSPCIVVSGLSSCNRIDGSCLENCPSGFYGRSCNIECPPNCENSCERTKGFCTDGCIPGWSDPHCDQTCLSYCKENTICNQEGHCPEGCEVGYTGEDCNKTCPSSCKENTTCNQKGHCPEGCQVGYTGEDCNQLCHYNCKNNTKCHQFNGQCLEECRVGLSGEACNETCNVNCGGNGDCDRKTGVCKHGCKNGFHGDECTHVNQTGGNVTDCSHCINGLCDMNSLICTKGCVAGSNSSKCFRAQVAGNKIWDKGMTLYVIPLVLVTAFFWTVVAILTLRRKKDQKKEQKEQTEEEEEEESDESEELEDE